MPRCTWGHALLGFAVTASAHAEELTGEDVAPPSFDASLPIWLPILLAAAVIGVGLIGWLYTQKPQRQREAAPRSHRENRVSHKPDGLRPVPAPAVTANDFTSVPHRTTRATEGAEPPRGGSRQPLVLEDEEDAQRPKARTPAAPVYEHAAHGGWNDAQHPTAPPIRAAHAPETQTRPEPAHAARSEAVLATSSLERLAYLAQRIPEGRPTHRESRGDALQMLDETVALLTSVTTWARQSPFAADEDEFEPYVALESHTAWIGYYRDLLAGLHENGQCTYTDAFGDPLTFTTTAEWLDAFAVSLLDPMAVRCSSLTLARWRGENTVALRTAERCFRETLKSAFPAALRSLGYDIVDTFVALADGESLAPTPGTMKVAGSLSLPHHSGAVVSTKVVGILRDRHLHRTAEVMTG
jgi:hypothetical protein